MTGDELLISPRDIVTGASLLISRIHGAEPIICPPMALQLTRTTRGTRSNFFPFHSLPSLFPSHFYFSILPPCFVHLKFTDNLETLEWIFSLLFLSVFSIIRDFKYRLSRKEYDRFCRIFLTRFPLLSFFIHFYRFQISVSRLSRTKQT